MPTHAPRNTREDVINLRATRSQKALIDRAATAAGKSRSEFMLESACRAAESALLDQRYFALPADRFKRFLAMLDEPPGNNRKLRRLLATPAPWEK